MMINLIKYLLSILSIALIFPQGNFQILNIPPSTRLLALSNSAHAMSDFTNSYNPASINSTKRNISIHSHIYPADIVYVRSEIILPIYANIYSFEYSNLNYGEFKDAETGDIFNSSEFLFKGSIKTHIFNKLSIGSSVAYAINKISDEVSQALFISLGLRTQIDNPRLGFGLSVNNIGKIIKNFSDYEESLPSSINMSTFYKPEYFPGFICLDIYKLNNIDKFQIRSGLELNINNYLCLRLGNNSNTIDLLDSSASYFSGLSGGVGIKGSNWNVDVGFYNLETAGIVSGISLLYKK